MANVRLNKVVVNLVLDDNRQVSFANIKKDATDTQIKNFVDAVKQSFVANLREAKKIVQEEIAE